MPWRSGLVVLAALCLAACSDTGTRQRKVALTECRLPRVPTAVQCATIEVPEDRNKPEGRKIPIFAAIMPANTASPKDDPLLILAGGPGQAASNLGVFAARLNDVRRTRDIVLIDQRGTGRSGALTCAAFKPAEDDVFETDPLPRARACLDELRAQGVDPARYTTTAWIADLEAMRQALGYPRWNLWGGSYGTRVAQEYARRHPDRVRTMILDGVAPPSLVIPLDIWVTREAAFAAVLAACAASEACRKAHPDVARSLHAIRDFLGPEGRELDVIDPATGAPRKLPMTFDRVVAMLQPLTYSPEGTSLLPQLLASAARGDVAPLMAAMPSTSPTQPEAMNAALLFSVTCAEDVPRIAPGSETRVLAPLPTRLLAERTLAVCGVWPRGDAPADFATPLASDIPTTLFSGGMDPVTPPAYGTEVAKGLSRSRHVIAPGYGHIVSLHACGPRAIAAFLEAADPGKLPATCVTHFEKSTPPPLWSNRLVAQP